MMKMTTKESEVIQGIILKQMPYKESDAILSVYTKEYGRISILARGIRKIKSKNSAACQSLTFSEFTVIVKKGMFPLIKASYIDYYRHIKEDIELEAYASYFMEFVYKFSEENNPDLLMFEQLKQALECLNQGYPAILVYLLFNAYILKVNGTPLNVDACSYCGSTKHIKGISYTSGGFVCSHCIGEYDKVCSKELLKAFRHINKFELKDIDQVNVEEGLWKELRQMMESYIDEYTGILFHTKKFLKQF